MIIIYYQILSVRKPRFPTRTDENYIFIDIDNETKSHYLYLPIYNIYKIFL